MAFRTVKKSLINKVLTPNAASNFRIAGYQKSALSAEEISGTSRLLSVYTPSLDLTGRETGPVQSKAVINLDFFVSAPAKVDLTVLDNPDATTAQRAAAIAASIDAASVADESMDEFWELVWNIVMNARYNQLGLDESVTVGAVTYPVDTGIKIAERYITRLDKDQPSEMGDHVVLTARAQITYKTVEQVSGLATTPMTEGIQDEIQFADNNGIIDTTTKTGVTVNP